MKLMITTVNMQDKKVYIGIGSNLNNREKLIKESIEEIKEFAKLKKQSKIIETEPVGYTNQGKFLNMVIEIDTNLEPLELLIKLQEIEHKLGRIREIKNGPRTIDLDILFYGDKIVNQPHLQIPHPHIEQREFVLEPLAEIAGEKIHPISKKSIETLLNEFRKN